MEDVDISNPSSPKVVGTKTITSGSTSIFVQGRYAYVTSPNSIFAIYDVSNPAAPTTAISYTAPTVYIFTPTYVYVQGRYAYVTSSRRAYHF